MIRNNFVRSFCQLGDIYCILQVLFGAVVSIGGRLCSELVLELRVTTDSISSWACILIASYSTSCLVAVRPDYLMFSWVYDIIDRLLLVYVITHDYPSTIFRNAVAAQGQTKIRDIKPASIKVMLRYVYMFQVWWWLMTWPQLYFHDQSLQHAATADTHSSCKSSYSSL